MTTTFGQLSLTAGQVDLEGHLPECELSEGNWRSCQWCLWAIDTPEFRTLQELTTDAATLLDLSDANSVPWIVAAVQLARTADSIDISARSVPSVVQLITGLEQRLRRLLTELDQRVTIAATAGGPIEARCIAASGTIAALVLQAEEHADTLAELPPGVQRSIRELNATLSPETQLAQLGPALDEQHDCETPRLLTQPEWQSLRPPDATRPVRSSSPRGPSPGPGSLEALVVESVIDDVIAKLSAVGRALEGLLPPVTVTRGSVDPTFSSRTRSMVWRNARIDWDLTLIDTGRADCWNTRFVDGHILTDVPWTVALAVEARKRLGFMSATRDG